MVLVDDLIVSHSSNGSCCALQLRGANRYAVHRTDKFDAQWFTHPSRQVLVHKPSGNAMKIRTFSLTILLLGATGVASADQDDGHRSVGRFHENVGMPHERIHIGASPTLQAPEIDPASLVAALTLLGGALAVLRGRRALNPSD